MTIIELKKQIELWSEKWNSTMGKTISRNKNLNYNIKIQYTSFIKLTKKEKVGEKKSIIHTSKNSGRLAKN